MWNTKNILSLKKYFNVKFMRTFCNIRHVLNIASWVLHKSIGVSWKVKLDKGLKQLLCDMIIDTYSRIIMQTPHSSDIIP